MNVRGKRIYIAGPMTGKERWNFPEFERHALLIEANGGIAVAPHRIDQAVWSFDGRPELPNGMCLRAVLPIDFFALATCDAIYLLAGWSKSKGARFERAWADCLGLEIIYAADAEQGGLGVLLEPTWEAAYRAELENCVIALSQGDDHLHGRCCPSRDAILRVFRERAAQTGLKPKK